MLPEAQEWMHVGIKMHCSRGFWTCVISKTTSHLAMTTFHQYLWSLMYLSRHEMCNCLRESTSISIEMEWLSQVVKKLSDRDNMCVALSLSPIHSLGLKPSALWKSLVMKAPVSLDSCHLTHDRQNFVLEQDAHLIWAARTNLSSKGFNWWRWQHIFLLHNQLLLLYTGTESCLMILRSVQLERLYRSGRSCSCGSLWCRSGAGGCHIIVWDSLSIERNCIRSILKYEKISPCSLMFALQDFILTIHDEAARVLMKSVALLLTTYFSQLALWYSSDILDEKI